MGAWGFGIRQDDFVCDIIGVFEDLLKAGKSVAEATKAIKSQFGAATKDADDEPDFWIALAEVQWTYGGLEASVLKRVREDFDSGRSLLRWEEDQRGLARRRAVLEKFIGKIGVANPRPKKPPKLVIRAPKFRPGDCLSIELAKGQYAAAIVLAADHSVPEYGKNLVAVLDYLSADKPTMEVFRKRKWFVLSHNSGNNRADVAWYQPIGFRKVKDRLEVVGQVEILDSDPKESNTYCGWAGIGDRAKYRHDRDAEGH
jgi:hypothetical protein